jgi:hypothetical protein
MRHSNGEQNDPMHLQSRERSGPQARESERFARGFGGSPADPSAATAADQCAIRMASRTIPCTFRAASEAGRRPARASGSRADSAVPPRIHPQRPERINAPSERRAERSHAPSEPRAKRAAGPRERAVRARIQRFPRGSIRSARSGSMRLPSGERNDPMRLQSRERSGPQARESERFARGFTGSPADSSAATAADQCAPRAASGTVPCAFRAASEAGRRPARAGGSRADPSAATGADQCAFRTANRTIPCAFRAASEAGRRPARASGSRADSAVRGRIHPQRPRRTNAPSERRAERSHAPSEPRAKRAAGPRERAVRPRIQRFARGFIRDIRSTPPISPSRLRGVSLFFSAPSSRISPSPLRKSFSVSPAGLSRVAAVRRLRPSARLPHGSPGSAHGACP